jgi:hypothetical protein
MLPVLILSHDSFKGNSETAIATAGFQANLTSVYHRRGLDLGVNNSRVGKYVR